MAECDNEENRCLLILVLAGKDERVQTKVV